MWVEKAKGWFLEFRMIPVLLWSYTAVVLGTAVAYQEGGTLNPVWFLVALALGGLIQGWVTHAINEIYDWRSGTDRIDGGRALSGGSRVRNLALLSERDLWIIFGFATLAVVGLTSWVILARAPWLVLLIGTGYILGLVYTLPPIATAYRPLAGEWLGGFPGVLLAGLGAFAVQRLSLSIVALAALAAHALVCTGMLVVHHYLDAPMDKIASPPKRTTVVVFGPRFSRWYAASMTGAAAAIYGLLGVLIHPAFLIGSGLTVVAVWVHARLDPTDMKSVTRNELRVIQLGIAAGLSTAVALAPPLWPMLPLAVAGYFAHLLVASPPAELARAWRKKPKTEPLTHRP